MPNITDLTPAGPLTGTEVLPIVQSGRAKSITVDSLTNSVIATAQPFIDAASASATAAGVSESNAATSASTSNTLKNDTSALKDQVTTLEASAEAAANMAWATARLYANTAAALADGTLAVGQYFSALSTDNLEVAIVYLKAAGPVATDTGKRIINASFLSANNGSKASYVITDTTGTRVLAYFSLTDGNWYTAGGGKLQGAPSWEETTAGTASLFSLKSNDGVRSFVINSSGRPYIRGLGAVLDSVPSNAFVQAKIYESFGDSTKSSFFYDKAKSELAAPFRVQKNVCYYSEDANTSFARFACPVVISDTQVLMLFSQRNSAVNNGEDLQRVVCRNLTIDQTTGSVTVGSTVVIDQPGGWAAGTGGYAAAPSAVRITSGAHAGRIVVLYNRTETDVLLNAASYERSIHMSYSDDNGATWSAHVKVMGSSQLYDTLAGGTGGEPGAVPARNGLASAGNCLIRLPSGAHAGRLVFGMYTDSSHFGSFYSDDDGITWTRGTLIQVGGKTYQEPVLTVGSDGNIYMLLRTDNNNGTICTAIGSGYAKSTDGGSTWTYLGHVTTEFANSSPSLLNASTQASDGFEKFLAGNDTGTGFFQRDKFQIRLSYDKGATFVAKASMFETEFNCGYTQLAKFPNGRYILAYETFNGNSAINVQDSIGILIFNEAELFRRATLV